MRYRRERAGIGVIPVMTGQTHGWTSYVRCSSACSGKGKASEQLTPFTSSNSNLYEEAHSWSPLSPGHQTCAQQGRTETATVAWCGELPLLVRPVTWKPRWQIRGKYSRLKENEGRNIQKCGGKGYREWRRGRERDTGMGGERECCIIYPFASWIIHILLSVLAATA